METVQIRLTRDMLKEIDILIKKGEYPNRSEAIRDGVRHLLFNKKNTNNLLNVSIKDLKDYIKEVDRK